MTEKRRIAAVEGWFTLDPREPVLIGSQCRKCRTYFFPKESLSCRNPGCGSEDLEEVALSARGKLWSYATNHYQPPPPYVSPDPFVPYSVAAVELERERMVVLGQLAAGVDAKSLRVGMAMELVVEKLFENEEGEHVVWKWRPVL